MNRGAGTGFLYGGPVCSYGSMSAGCRYQGREG